MDRIEKDISEIHWDSVDFKSGSWSWGRGGLPLKDNEYSISYVSEELIETRYKLPQCINIMLRRTEEWGKTDAQGKMKRALGI